jgi:hypothetical protein
MNAPLLAVVIPVVLFGCSGSSQELTALECGSGETLFVERGTRTDDELRALCPTASQDDVDVDQISTTTTAQTQTTEAPRTTPLECPNQPERWEIYDALNAGQIGESEAIAATCDFPLFEAELRTRTAIASGADPCAAVAMRADDDADVFDTCREEGESSTSLCDSLEALLETESSDAAALADAACGLASQDLLLEQCGDPSRGAAGRITNPFERTRSVTVTVVIVDESGLRVADGIDFIRDLRPGQTATWEAIITGPWTGTCDVSADWL